MENQENINIDNVNTETAADNRQTFTPNYAAPATKPRKVVRIKKSKTQLTMESDLRRGIKVKSFKLHKDEIAEFERVTRMNNMTNRAMLVLMMNEFKKNHGIE